MRMARRLRKARLRRTRLCGVLFGVLFPLFAAKTVCEAGCRVGHELAWLFKAAGMVHVFEGGGAKIRGMKSVLWLREKAAVWRIILLVFLSRTLLTPFLCQGGALPRTSFSNQKVLIQISLCNTGAQPVLRRCR